MWGPITRPAVIFSKCPALSTASRLIPLSRTQNSASHSDDHREQNIQGGRRRQTSANSVSGLHFEWLWLDLTSLAWRGWLASDRGLSSEAAGVRTTGLPLVRPCDFWEIRSSGLCSSTLSLRVCDNRKKSLKVWERWKRRNWESVVDDFENVTKEWRKQIRHCKRAVNEKQKMQYNRMCYNSWWNTNIKCNAGAVNRKINRYLNILYK